MTFKQLTIGQLFHFDHSGLAGLWSGATGPWIKVSPRCYIHATHEGRGTLPGHIRVGSINVKVETEDRPNG